MDVELNNSLRQNLLQAQKNEITEHIIYKKLSLLLKDEHNRTIVEKISEDELRHYNIWKSITKTDVTADKLKIFFYIFVARFFGLTFGVKLLESGEGFAQNVYSKIKEKIPQTDKIIQDEERHEFELINLIDEERLKYVSSVVLGLNDALVELSGALVGFTLALQNTRLVAIVGLITGIAASLSMAASEYLSIKHQDDTQKNPFKASIYTGLAYIFTVILLISPYLIFKNIFLCLSFVLLFVLLIITVFTFYTAVAKNLDFKKRFIEMARLSLSIAIINFLIGIIIRKTFGIDI
ncbi:MAG: VIT1/CCC1 transporter family protein [Candidatus Omnitrophota bacterium]